MSLSMESFWAGFGIRLGETLRFLSTDQRNRDRYMWPGNGYGSARNDNSKTDGVNDGEGGLILEEVGGGGRRAEKFESFKGHSKKSSPAPNNP